MRRLHPEEERSERRLQKRQHQKRNLEARPQLPLLKLLPPPMNLLLFLNLPLLKNQPPLLNLLQ